jgi:hypothetical protein
VEEKATFLSRGRGVDREREREREREIGKNMMKAD